MASHADLRSRIGQIIAEYRTPGAAVGILHRGEMITWAYGVTDVVTGSPVSTDTVFQCGSLTKTWTALAFMQLVDDGAVGLDEPVRAYLPGFRVADPIASALVTPRMLLNHTNGIEESYGDPGENNDVYERMVDAIATAPQVSPPGYTHGYSAALGYAILARILEVIEGKPWDVVMTDRVLAPMGADTTTVWRGDNAPRDAARGHLVRSPGEGPTPTPVDYLPRAYSPGGGISSTVGDVLGLARVFLNGVAANGYRVLSRDSVREMMSSRVPIPDPYLLGSEWALGLVYSEWGGRAVYGHDGSTIGQNARMRFVPYDDLALVLLTNGDARDSLYTRIFDTILSELGSVTIPPLPTPDATLALDPARYVGVYERPGAHFDVTSDGVRLRLTMSVDPLQADFLGIPRQITHDLLPIDETTFLMPPTGVMEEVQTAAIFDFRGGHARYLHTNARLHPRRP